MIAEARFFTSKTEELSAKILYGKDAVRLQNRLIAQIEKKNPCINLYIIPAIRNSSAISYKNKQLVHTICTYLNSMDSVTAFRILKEIGLSRSMTIPDIIQKCLCSKYACEIFARNLNSVQPLPPLKPISKVSYKDSQVDISNLENQIELTLGPKLVDTYSGKKIQTVKEAMIANGVSQSTKYAKYAEDQRKRLEGLKYSKTSAYLYQRAQEKLNKKPKTFVSKIWNGFKNLLGL